MKLLRISCLLVALWTGVVLVAAGGDARFTRKPGDAPPRLDANAETKATSTLAPSATSTNAAATTNATKAAKIPITPLPKPVPAIVRGPYLQLGTTNSMVVRWRTDIAGPSVVRYASSLTNLNKKASSAGNLTEHVVLLSGLQPDTRYFYAIGTNDCPILATLTNNVLAVRATNGVLAISSLKREQFAKITNGTFFVSRRRNLLMISSLEKTNLIATGHSSLVVSTTNNTLRVAISDGALDVSTTNISVKTSSKTFVVGATNVTFVGPDTNTFFYTNPRIGTVKPVRVWVVGDPGTRKPEEKSVRDAYYKFTGNRRTDVWLLLGDNAYQSGTDAEYQGAIFDMYPDLLKRCVLWPTLGNHDAGSANSPTQSGVYYDIFTLPTQGQSGGVMSGTEAYYSFDYANVHFICLDSANSDRSTNGLMLKWLKADLAANRQEWCVAYCHHPPYTKGSHDSDMDKDSDGIMRDMRGTLMPALEAGGVDLVLNGHSHAYERSYLLDGLYKYSPSLEDAKNIISTRDGRADGWGVYQKPTRGPAPHEGTVYVVAGSAGQTSGGALLHPAMYASFNILGSLVLDFDGPRVDSSFVDTNGFVRDYFSIVKGSGRSPPPNIAPAESVVTRGALKIPRRLLSLLPEGQGTEGLFAATNAVPDDQDLLLSLYDETSNPTQKTNLTWALAYTGDADVTTNFLYVLTRLHKGREISEAEENLLFETVQAIGFLAERYQAPFEFLKKYTNPQQFQTNKLWLSPRGYSSAGLLASCCIQSLGLSGRPEAKEILTGLQKKNAEYRLKEHPAYVRHFSHDIDQGLLYYRAFHEFGTMQFQRKILTGQLPRPLVE